MFGLIGSSQWVPEGENKHSQSVIDLFEFVRESAQVILHDLPLSEYKRAVYLIDLSKVSRNLFHISMIYIRLIVDQTRPSPSP